MNKNSGESITTPESGPVSPNRRSFLKQLFASTTLLTLNYAGAAPSSGSSGEKVYRKFEDVYRKKWTWDRVVRGSHGTNCAGNCAFNVYVKNGIVWREEQQGEYGGYPDAPDYGPRGCQKGLRHAKYMYSSHRVLYPMKRVGKRGEGKWERISWEQATDEIADKFLDIALKYGPDSISFGSGTQMALKLASAAGLYRFCAITGVTSPEFLSGVGDLPTGSQITLGQTYATDTMAAIFKSKCVLVWMANPAVTRIPDAHFFWEARYNGAEVIAISPDFTPTAMHSSLWVNPKPGTDAALAMAMVHVILEEKLYRADYIREQTDLPLLVRKDNQRLLRVSDFERLANPSVDGGGFFVWDEATNALARAPGSGTGEVAASLELGNLRPALEGSWRVRGLDGEIEVTTVFELLKARAAEHTPELVAEETGVNPKVTRHVARTFAAAKPAMIYCGYAACKWLHGDLLQRAMILMLSLTGNIGVEGGGFQIATAARTRGGTITDGVRRPIRRVSATTWDYDHARMHELTEQLYGKEIAQEFHAYYKEARRRGWYPDYGKNGWKMGIFAGQNGVSWRASASRWRKEAFEKLECIVAMVPEVGATMLYADYVLPIAHHYERVDMLLQGRMPYVQVMDAAVPPLGESVDDWEAIRRLAEAISRRARARGITTIEDEIDGKKVIRDYANCHDLYTYGGRIKSTKDIVADIISSLPGMPKMSFEEFAKKGIVRLAHSERTSWDHKDALYHSEVYQSVRHKTPYRTVSGRQSFYIDHEWFLKFDEALPTYKKPLKEKKPYPLRMMMGHARHSIHSMWRTDSFLLSLQRGEPDVYVNPDDAAKRGVKDGDMIRIFNDFGEFYAMAHVTAGMQPGMIFSYHGWDPLMYRNRQNFSAVISTSGLIKPTSMAGGYGQVDHRTIGYSPNMQFKDFTCDFEKAADEDVRKRA